MSTIERSLPPLNVDERTTLESWLDFHRATLAMKCEGLDDEQAVVASVPPSGFTLTGLVQHMAEVERNWFRRVLAGEQSVVIGRGHGARGGLRERKKLAVRRALSSAAVRLAVERGLENVTIEDITAEADVSVRRFGNYFSSKCPLRSRCTRAAHGKWGRSLTLLPREQHELLARQRAEQQTPQWKARYNIRADIEGTISQAVRRTRLRRTPYHGQPKTHLASVLSATAINLIRADAWLNGTPLGTTRVSHLSRLELAA